MIYEPFVKDTNPPTPGGDQLQLNFLNMYIQSLDPRAQAIMAMGGGIARQNACMALAQTSGLFLDYDIVGQGWDPLFTMSFLFCR